MFSWLADLLACNTERACATREARYVRNAAIWTEYHARRARLAAAKQALRDAKRGA